MVWKIVDYFIIVVPIQFVWFFFCHVCYRYCVWQTIDYWKLHIIIYLNCSKLVRILSFADPSIPTINTNVENTDTGHCAKTLSIFKYVAHELDFNRSLTDIKWIVLADDDTLLRYAHPSNQFTHHSHRMHATEYNRERIVEYNCWMQASILGMCANIRGAFSILLRWIINILIFSIFHTYERRFLARGIPMCRMHMRTEQQ